MNARWLSSILVGVLAVMINVDIQKITDAKLLHHLRKLNTTTKKRHYVVTEEETQDTFFVPHGVQPPPLVPPYPVSVITQPAVPVTKPSPPKHEQEHSQGHKIEHVFLQEHEKERLKQEQEEMRKEKEREKEMERKKEREREKEIEREEKEREKEQLNAQANKNNAEQETTSGQLKVKLKQYRAIGCYKDAIPRAVPSLEGSDSELKQYYTTRLDAVEKCAKVAKARGYQIFTIQNGGFCSSGPNAHVTFETYGPADNCVNGRGGHWASNVYIFNDYLYEITVHTGTEQKSSTDAKVSVTLYGTLGTSRSMVLKSDTLTYNNPFQSGRVVKFMVHTVPLGDLTRLHICHDNTGLQPEWYLENVSIKDPRNKIYIFPCNCWLKNDRGKNQRNLFPATVLNPGRYKYIGCYKERQEKRAIPSVSKMSDMLNGHPSSAITTTANCCNNTNNNNNNEDNIIERCADEARRKGNLFFAIHNGNVCATSSTAQDTYNMYGSAVNCNKDGTGGLTSNAVYSFNDQEPISTSTSDAS